MIYHKRLSMKECLEYVAFAILKIDAPENFDGDITCEVNDDGDVDVYLVSSKSINNDSNNIN